MEWLAIVVVVIVILSWLRRNDSSERTSGRSQGTRHGRQPARHDEPWFTELDNAAASGTTHEWVGREVEFGYRKPSGEVTRRRIRVESVFSWNDASYVRGYCLLRQSGRTFRLDRLTSAIVDCATGEVLR